MAKDFLLETMARAEAMLDQEMHFISKTDPLAPSILITDEFKDEEEDETTTEQIQTKRQSLGSDNDRDGIMKVDDMDQQEYSSAHISPLEIDTKSTTETETQYMVKHRKFEVNTLCRIFLGQMGVTTFSVFICLYMIGILWGRFET
jgi:hypothetical protein